MSASKQFKKLFSYQMLYDLYFQQIQAKASVGIDRINSKTFERDLKDNVEIISKKTLNGTYRFSYYKEKLISKGRDSNPRVISIPTIRDKLTLRALNNVLFEVFKEDLNTEIVQTIVSRIKNAVYANTHDFVIKIDLENFYPSIEHTILEKKLRKRVRKKEILALVNRAIKQSTVSKPPYPKKKYIRGVPQGLSISNLLANIYMIEFDKKYLDKSSILYRRFVDDILILCNKDSSGQIFDEVKNDISDLGLTIHPDKKHLEPISKPFSYLGYFVSQEKITVREKSVVKLKESIVKLFTEGKYAKKNNSNILQWKLNLRITGCVFEDKKYGWLFFFSQIDDKTLLSELDWYVARLIKRFRINPSKVTAKKFLRTYHEITQNLSQTTYIPKFSEYDSKDKRMLLATLMPGKNIEEWDDSSIDKMFSKTIRRSIKDLEKDIQHIS